MQILFFGVTAVSAAFIAGKLIAISIAFFSYMI